MTNNDNGRLSVSNQRVHILNFPFNRVGLRIDCLAATPAVKIIDCEMLCQFARQRRVKTVVCQRSADDDQWLTLA